jgi:hypothetical protein
MLREHLATPERWLDQFDQTAIPAPPDDLGANKVLASVGVSGRII